MICSLNIIRHKKKQFKVKSNKYVCSEISKLKNAYTSYCFHNEWSENLVTRSHKKKNVIYFTFPSARYRLWNNLRKTLCSKKKILLLKNIWKAVMQIFHLLNKSFSKKKGSTDMRAHFVTHWRLSRQKGKQYREEEEKNKVLR